MKYVRQNGSVVLTQDLDFGSILAAQHLANPSVIQVRSDNLDIEAIGSTIVQAISRLEHELASGALITIDPQRTRVRILPIR
jgi:predicted nuclease of predicted toxin-antitoxin system